MRITLALPDHRLYKNTHSRVIWGRVRATKQYRADAATMARVQLGPYDKPLWRRAHAKIVFYFEGARHFRDPDNLLGALAPVWDGFQDAKLLNNDRVLSFGMIEQDVDKKSPRVVIEITEGYPPGVEGRDERQAG